MLATFGDDRNVQALAATASYVAAMDNTPIRAADADPVATAARCLSSTAMLDYRHPTIQQLVEAQAWAALPEFERVGAAYTWVRDQLPFGYNTADDLAASAVLADGIGQCNTKTTLLMALLRAVRIPCRLHGATIHKELQHGLVNGLLYRLTPDEIVHTWAEVLIAGDWIRLEGVILDRDYLDGLRNRFPSATGSFLGYAVGTDDLANPPIDWSGTDTAIQSTGLDSDHGVFDDPDSFYAQHEATLRGLRAWIFRHFVRHTMNRNVIRLRACPPTSGLVGGGDPR